MSKGARISPLFYAFVNCDIAVDGEICEVLLASAGSKPNDLMAIDFRALANPTTMRGSCEER